MKEVVLLRQEAKAAITPTPISISLYLYSIIMTPHLLQAIHLFGLTGVTENNKDIWEIP